MKPCIRILWARTKGIISSSMLRIASGDGVFNFALLHPLAATHGPGAESG